MTEEPYTRPEDDPFGVNPIHLRPRRRRSSMLDKWIQDQQQTFTPPPSPHLLDPRASSLSCAGPAARSNPYLAYPDLSKNTHSPSAQSSTVTLDAYDLVDDLDIPDSSPAISEPHLTPNSLKSGIFNPPQSFRSLHLSFRSASSPTPPPPPSVSPTSPRMHFFGLGKGSPRSPNHNRSSSLGTLATPRHPPSPSGTPSKWRPSVFNIFVTPETPELPEDAQTESVDTPPRPSMSSSNTYTSSPTPETPLAPLSKVSLVDSIRSRRRRSYGSLLSSGSVTKAGSENIIPSIESVYSEDTGATRVENSTVGSGTIRVPFGSKLAARLANTGQDDDEADEAPRVQPVKVTEPSKLPQVAFSSAKEPSTISRAAFASLSSKERKKKKLIISGIGANDTRKFEGAKRWCESFGEVSQILRMPNGDLHVHFKSASVAETVCRLRAKVYIAGVGSVNLSWYSGTKR